MNFPMSGKPKGLVLYIRLAACCAAFTLVACLESSPAHALSQIQREELPSPVTPPTDSDSSAPGSTVPMPDPVGTPSTSQPAAPDAAEPDSPSDGSSNRPRVDPEAPLPEVVYDLAKLPEPVRRMHDLIIEACRTGDIEKLRPLIGTGDSMTQLSLADIDGDAIAFLKGLSGDPDGQEILAILEEVLSAGYVHVDAGTPQELYVWPYFFALPLDKLDAKQRVELFKIVTAGDFDDMKQFGAYIFYRVGITPAGQWTFFVAGD
ncbi:alanine and proline-rich secreted protein Apa [Mesorhizobium sp. B283B1A]|uniref:alanine and proline-rich secreted protein Apa n=1 Tax=Mesorhizobium TaxID=68287 RepID=UPI001CD09FCA|nr:MULTISPECIES: alanine and proline-rich secreted protein Apa [Mesorhizobium]MCA0050872.1 alanine and proline-rich secreted protein Apa [Mesorhizobium sp. B283B1A]UQS63676.1 alanine and proline-rich secreted protein Apa [Mesorhizobium opportunistum]